VAIGAASMLCYLWHARQRNALFSLKLFTNRTFLSAAAASPGVSAAACCRL
jgi:hypothetical protein